MTLEKALTDLRKLAEEVEGLLSRTEASHVAGLISDEDWEVARSHIESRLNGINESIRIVELRKTAEDAAKRLLGGS